MRRISYCFRNEWIQIFAVCFLANPQVTLRADVFEIRGGGTITGKLLNDPKDSVFKILTNDGIEIEIASSKLKPPILIPSDFEASYKKLLQGKEDTVELHRAMSLECAKQGPVALSYAHKERVVELDPSDENWKALGEHSWDAQYGEWIHRDKKFKRQGMKSIAGNKWDTPESQAIKKVETDQKTSNAEMKKQIDENMRSLTDRTKGAKARQFFATLNDPACISTLHDYLKKETSVDKVSIYMEILGRMPNGSANWVFVDLAMASKNAQLVNQCIEMLQRTEAGREYAFNSFWNVIRNTKAKPEAVDRAGTHLQVFQDKRATKDLIERLVSILTITSANSPTTGISNDGGINMPMGSGKKVEKRIYEHQPVLTALIALTDGANYQYDIPEWRNWFARTYAITNLDLRRDE